jgi:5-methylcytosine-specific restriction endonuclease McrA
LSFQPLIFSPGCNFFWSQFAHVLPKDRYPKFKLKLENIVLLTPAEHRMYDHGTEKERKKHPECDWRKLDALKQQLKREYRGF